MSESFQLREVFNKDIVDHIAKNIKNQYSDFEKDKFIKYIFPKLNELSFGDRSNLITEALEIYLPKNFENAASILLKSLGPELEIDDLSGYEGFYIMPLGNYVARNGKEYFELSMKLLYEMTKRFTSEGPIRTFIELYPQDTLKLLHTWTEDENSHVRRLVSEGTRPRLPLTSPLRSFILDPTPVVELLTKLNSSPELFVRRSIANNLNDISKDNPKIVTDTLRKWQKKDKSKNMDWLIKHALRTLLKQGNQEALELLGYSKDPSIEILNFTLQNSPVKIGEKLTFEFEIMNTSSTQQKLMIEYIVYYMKHNGKLKPKVFKLSKKQLKARTTIKFSRALKIAQMSTRKVYPGKHEIQLQINGLKLEKYMFEVIN